MVQTASQIVQCPETFLIAGKEFYSCPPLRDDVAGICVEECSSDDDCQSSEKCCSNGCGHSCTRAVTIPHYNPPTNTPGSQACQLLLNQITRNTSLIGAYVPQCNSDGSFSSVQCHSSTGYCWCVNVQTGEAVSGFVRFGGQECASMSTSFLPPSPSPKPLSSSFSTLFG